MGKTILLIDYENIQQIDLSSIAGLDIAIKIFIGRSQNKIPFELVMNAQQFGRSIEWIKIDGNGNNALDFHIAYYLGYMSREHIEDTYIVLSKDKGFDPLIRYINKKNVTCKRINSILEISAKEDKPVINEMHMKKVLDNLFKIDKSKRPRKRSTLQKHILSLIKGTMTEKEAAEIIDQLFIDLKLTEENERLKYNF